MITTKLLGGLSNQMFQIAAIQSLAWKHGDECAFPFDRTEMGQGKPVRAYIKNVFRNIKELPRNFRPQYIYDEPIVNGQLQLNYKPIPYHKFMQARGYFPSEKYFADYKKEIIQMYKAGDLIEKVQTDFEKSFPLKNSVSIHVRRGDYLLSRDFLTVLPLFYYQRAMREVERQRQIDIILMFSDDIEWCKLNFNDKRMVFIEGHPDYEDLYLMSLCENHIIANSGFSWWGSYLNESEDKIVVAPKKWFGVNGPAGFYDQYLPTMIQV